MPKQINLDDWLNSHLFRRSDLHKTFRTLFRTGADLHYVLFLSGVFSFGDNLRRRLGFDKRKGLISLCPPAPVAPSARVSEVLMDAAQLQKLLAGKGESDMAFRKLASLCDALPELCDEVPLFTLIFHFGFPRTFFNGRGDPGDPWGNFFLLAVVEHLSRGRRRSSKHKLAYELLVTLRKESIGIENLKVNTAVRVANLKKASPQWQSALSLLHSEFSRFGCARCQVG